MNGSTSTGVMAKAVLLAIGASDAEADKIMHGELAHRVVPQTPEQVLAELAEALTKLRRLA